VREAGPEQFFDRRQSRRGQGVHQAVDVLAAGHRAGVAEPTASTAAPWFGSAVPSAGRPRLPIADLGGLFADSWPARRLDDLAVLGEPAGQRLAVWCAIRDSNPEPAD
jgi:hypothetical protein